MFRSNTAAYSWLLVRNVGRCFALAADNGIYKEGAAAPEWRPPYRDAYAFNGKKSVLLKTF
jgi:hypothetical protein